MLGRVAPAFAVDRLLRHGPDARHARPGDRAQPPQAGPAGAAARRTTSWPGRPWRTRASSSRDWRSAGASCWLPELRPEDLRAPVDGVIAATALLPARWSAPSDQLFQIIDPASLLVEALVFDQINPDRGRRGHRHARRRAAIKLKFLGRSRALQQQYSILQFQIVETPVCSQRRRARHGGCVNRRAHHRHRAAAGGAGAGAERADGRLQPQGAGGVRAPAGALRDFRWRRTCWSRVASPPARRSSCAMPRCSTRCGDGGPMFNLLVTRQSEEQAAGAGGGRRARRLRQLRAAAPCRSTCSPTSTVPPWC